MSATQQRSATRRSISQQRQKEKQKPQPIPLEEESIYNFVKVDVVAPKKDPRYKSKHPAKCPPTGSTFGMHGTTKTTARNAGGEEEQKGHNSANVNTGGTLGPRGSVKPSPTDILHKGQGKDHVMTRKESHGVTHSPGRGRWRIYVTAPVMYSCRLLALNA
eukprot:GHVU01013877.1.p2 GENE.GHVU01013877.1~~GHVU01013877.1.p2  ORF type:complete len:161 (-),score=14.05 GHVU01013877.1:2209-2691(-)